MTQATLPSASKFALTTLNQQSNTQHKLQVSTTMPTPRCFIVRHGETEWSLNGRHTGTTDLPLTANGRHRMRATGKAMVGNDRLIVPGKLAKIYVSSRKRAQETLSLLLPETRAHLQNEGEKKPAVDIEVTDAIREWDYGDYEGLTSAQIKETRERNGQGPWDIWSEGCPGGETPEDVIKRLDVLVHKIREEHHRPAFDNHSAEGRKSDVLIVAHGHILRAFALRWTEKPLEHAAFILEAGGVGTLSYEHHKIDEPAIILGGSFVVPEVIADDSRPA